MAVRPFRRRVLLAVLAAVALPALLLAGLSIYLTERITRSVETASATYHSYIGLQIAEALETDLMSHLKRALTPAEAAVHAGVDPRALDRGLEREGAQRRPRRRVERAFVGAAVSRLTRSRRKRPGKC